MLQTFLQNYTFNAPSWSISAEFWTYIIFAIVLIFKFNFTANLVILIAILVFRFNNDISFAASHSGYLSLLDCIYSFFCGVFFSKLYLNFSKNKIYIKSSNLMSTLLLLIVFFSIPNLQGKFLFTLPIIFSLLIFFSCDVRKESYLGFLICNKIFIYLGKISYSIYMCHLFIFWFTTNTLRFIFKFNTYLDQSGIVRLDLTVAQSTYLVIICYFFTIIFSILSFRFIEKKFYKN